MDEVCRYSPENTAEPDGSQVSDPDGDLYKVFTPDVAARHRVHGQEVESSF